MPTQFQVLSRKLPFWVILKIFKVDVNVIVVIRPHHLNHLKLWLILGTLFGNTKGVYILLLCVFLFGMRIVRPNIPSFLQSTQVQWLRRLEPRAKARCKLSEYWGGRCPHRKGLKREDQKTLSSGKPQNNSIEEFCTTMSTPRYLSRPEAKAGGVSRTLFCT